MKESAWNSLEIAKLSIAALTPVFVAIVGFWLNRRLKSLEQAQWSQQKVIERRIKAYDDLATPLNQLFCFYCYVGTWKELSPPEVVQMKRKLDQTAYTSAPLFDDQFLPRYNALMDACFTILGEWGTDAKLRTLPDRREEAAHMAGKPWRPTWESCFASRDEKCDPNQVKDAYADLMAYLAAAIGAVEVDAHLLGSAQLPENFESRAAGMVPDLQSETPAEA
jgi:hypothetical protein